MGWVAARALASRPTVDERSGRDADGGSSCTPRRRSIAQRTVDASLLTSSPTEERLECLLVSSVNDLPSHDVPMPDVVPAIALEILGDRLPRIARHTFVLSGQAFKVDFGLRAAFRGFAQMHDERAQFMLVDCLMKLRMNAWWLMARCQPHRLYWLAAVFGGTQVGLREMSSDLAYAHVPHGYTGDATEAIVEQIERFAPGFRDRVVGMAVRSTAEMSKYNENYVMRPHRRPVRHYRPSFDHV